MPKEFVGRVVSNKMQKTVVVEVETKKPHPLYKKIVRKTKKYKVHWEGKKKLDEGTIVRIRETRPISKEKHFKVVEVL